MRIERVDEKTVKCFLSNEELEEYEIDYRDFVLRSDKAREIVQEIIEQAAQEVGYRPPRFAFDLQIMMVPDQGLLLTFSDRDSEIKESERFLECLREMKQILQMARERMGEAGEAPPESQQVRRPTFAVFEFAGLGKLMDYASMLPTNLQVDSRLYEMDGRYFLYLLKGRASYERYSRACVQALEFSALYAADPILTARLEEHGRCLIPEKAVRKLRK